MGIYYLHGIILPSGALISEIDDLTPATNTEELVGFAAGHYQPLFRGIRGQTPDASFTVNAIGQVMAAIIAGGNNYGLSLVGNTDMGYRQGEDRGTRLALNTSNHERLRMSKAFLVWNTIEATHQQDASIACRLIACYDGTNIPVVSVGTGSLSGTPAATQFYTLGPVTINGVAVSDVQNISLASGIEIETQGGQGDPWPTYVAIKTVDPVLSITRHDKPWADYHSSGGAITSLVAYLRAKDEDGDNVANGSASHIKITATNGLILPENTSGGGNDPAVTTLRIGLRAPNSNTDILTIDTASLIT